MKKMSILMILFCLAAVVYGSLYTPSVSNSSSTTIWSMESYTTLSDGKVRLVCPGITAWNLCCYDGDAPLNPTQRGGITQVDGRAGFGKAMYFDGVNDYGQMYQNITTPESIRIEMWIWISGDDTGVDKWIMEFSNPYRLYANNEGTLLSWVVQDNTGKAYYNQVAVSPNTWLYISAINNAGSTSLKVYNESGGLIGSATKTLDAPVYVKSTRPYLGGFGLARYFKGMIDDVHIWTDPTIGAAEILNGGIAVHADTQKGTYALWHLDESIPGTYPTTPDDDSLNPERDMFLYVLGGAKIGDPKFTSGDPNIYPLADSAFGKAAIFENIGDYLHGDDKAINVDPSNFKFEAWVRLHPDSNTLSGISYWIVNMSPMLRIYTAPGGAVRAYVYRDGVPYGGIVGPSNILLPNVWTHIAATFYDGILKVFANGEKIGEVNVGGTADSFTGRVIVGAYNSSTVDRFFWGMIDEVRVSNAVMPSLVCGDLGYLNGDFNRDCYVDIDDFVIMVNNWLSCTFPGNPECVDLF